MGGGGGVPHPAHEALRMPEGVEGRDVVLQDGASAATTLGREHVKVVLPTVGLAVLLMESWGYTGLGGAVRCQGYEDSLLLHPVSRVAAATHTFRAEESSTLGTEEMLGVPRAVQGSHHFL